MKFQRAKNIVLAAIIVLSTIASSLVTSNNTLAATTPAVYIAPAVRADAVASALRVSLALCMTIDGDSHMNGPDGQLSYSVTADHLASGDWFYKKSEPQARVGYLVDSDNGQVECQNLFKSANVAGTFGFASNMELACALGVKRINGSNCVNGTGDLTSFGVSKNDIYTALDKQRKNASGQGDNDRPGGFNGAQYYVMAAETYRTTCGATAVTTLDAANADQKNNSSYTKVDVIDARGGKTTVLYKKDNNSGKAFRNDEGDFHYINENCDWMAKQMNANASAYRTFVLAHGPGSPGIPGTCTEAFKTDAEVKACQAGFDNKADEGYCSTHYQPFPTPSKEYTACVYGRGTATARDGTTEIPVETTEGDDASAPTCTIEGIGWLICPVVTFMAKIVDGAYGFVASLLVVQPLLTTASTGDPIYAAWSAMRNFANVVFVIAFLLIIFSQLTSVGITNYGIKKMLPRLIVAAILVNVSYWICAIAIDLSNIIGGSINDVLKGIKDDGVAIPSAGAFSGGDGGWQGIVGPLLAGTLVVAAILYATLSALIPALIAALLAIVTVFLVLTIRQALIILLIVVSPLAFVAYLLPNTESLFKKWRDLLKTLLLMYPIIAGIFGASALASTVVMNSVSDDNPYKIAIQIMGALISIIPLALTPLVMKTAGGLLNKIGGVVNNPNKGPFDRMRKAGEKFGEQRGAIARTRRIGRAEKTINGKGGVLGDNGSRRRRTAAWIRGSGVSTSINNQQRAQSAKNALATAEQNYVANRVAGSAGANSGANAQYLQSIAGPTGNAAKVEAQAVAVQKRALKEAIESAELSANISPGDAGMTEMADRLERAIRSGDTITAQAMQNKLMTSGSKGLSTYRDKMKDIGDGTDGDELMRSQTIKDMSKNMLDNHGKVKGDAADLITQAATGRKMSAVSNDASTWSGLSDAELVRQKTASLQLAVGSNSISATQARRIKNNPELIQHLAPEIRDHINRLAP